MNMLLLLLFGILRLCCDDDRVRIGKGVVDRGANGYGS
jgi:hypothetical protein